MKTLHFLYHELRAEPSRYSYVTPCEEFERHCALFHRLQTPEGAPRLRPEVTFDDGNLSDFEYALPVLERHGLKAHFFITAGWTAERPGFMGWSELRALHAAGHSVGAHGWSHKLLTTCTAAELLQEVQGAKARLEDGLGAGISTMSLPGGRSNARVLRACKAAGYSQVFTSVPTSVDLATQPELVGRLNLLSGTSTEWLERVLDPSTGLLARLQRADKVKATAKSLLGDKLYAGLWALVNRQEPETKTGAPAA